MPDNLLTEYLNLPDALARRAFLEPPERAGQATRLVGELVAEVDTALRSDPPQALRLAEIALETVGAVPALVQAQGQARRAKANALRALGRFEESLPLYVEAAELFRRGNLPAEEGRTYLGELAALSNLGRYAECLRRGATYRRRLAALGDRLNGAKLASTLAIVNHHLGRYKEALRLHNRALKTFEQLGMPEMLPPGQVNRANTLTQLHRFQAATDDYQAARRFFEERGMRALLPNIDINMGFLLSRQGRYNEALALLESARAGFETTGQIDKRALSELDLAFTFTALNLHAEALAYYDRAAATMAELKMRYEVIRVEIGRAETLINQGNYEYAGQRLQAVLDTFDQAEDSERNRHALAIVWLYRAYLLARAEPVRLAESLELSSQARAAFKELGLVYWHAQALIVEADLLRQAQRWQEAASAYGAARQPVQRLKLPHLLYQLYYGEGRLHQERLVAGDGEVDQRKLTEAAQRSYLQAAEQVESIRALLRPEELRVAFMEHGLNAYERMVELCLADRDNPDRAREAFGYVERSKSRALLDLLSQDMQLAGVKAVRPEGDHLAARVEELRRELNWFYSQAHSPGLNLAGEEQRLAALDLEQIGHEVEVRERELAGLLRRLSLDPFDITPGVQTDDIAQPGLASDLARQLGEGETLLEYYALNGRVMAFAVDRQGVRLYNDLCEMDEVCDLQERLNFQADKFNLGRSYVERRMPALKQAFDLYLTELYRLLIRPLEAELRGERLLIVPHGSLHTLPFHALCDGQSYLIERFEVAYAPSAGVLLRCLEQPDRPANRLLALAVPDEKLPGVEAEVRSLEGLFDQARTLVGPQATLAGLQANLDWCEVLHLASHGVFREDNPLFSMLKLSDGWLSVHDVMGWRFRPSLVTLSACQTGLNRPLRGDELLGLARGFLSAGAYSLVVSLWSVTDEITAWLMQKFYSRLAAGAGRAAALRQAMLELKQDERYAHPHYWAPFVVVGRP